MCIDTKPLPCDEFDISNGKSLQTYRICPELTIEIKFYYLSLEKCY